MSSILEKVRTATTKRRQTAMGELVAIAKREANGKAKSADADRAAELLDALNMTPEKFAEMVATAKEVIELTEAAKDVDGKQARMRDAQKAAAAHLAEDEKLKKDRREHFFSVLQPAQGKAESTYSAACNARARLAQLKQEMPEMF